MNEINSIYFSGSAFNGNSTQAFRPISKISNRQRTNYVSLSIWCDRNNVSKFVGYTLIKKKLLIAQRYGGQWWVTSNPDCQQKLLDYLGVERLVFDANN